MKKSYEMVVDLSHTLHPDVPTWHGGNADYTLTTTLDYNDCSSETKVQGTTRFP